MRNRTSFRAIAFVMLTTVFVMMSGCEAIDPLDEYRSQGAPIITSLSPEQVITGVSAIITGELFLDEQGEDGKVEIFCDDNGTAVEAVILSWSENVIEFRVPSPSNLNARYPVEVTNNNGIKCPYSAYIDIMSGLPIDAVQ